MKDFDDLFSGLTGKEEDLREIFDNDNSKTYVLKTKRTSCHVCGVCALSLVKRNHQEVYVLTRNGINRAVHQEFRCTNRNKCKPCRA